ncbi:Gfo/Idh/MocA family protein [Nonomuraea sp. CA-218870]|uniref:Gfo/Idh/MocA family protein n=1 Tax=Nonomuraea sp. CA-218870 TaxID=3239998 RepID=UPI003D8B66B7
MTVHASRKPVNVRTKSPPLRFGVLGCADIAWKRTLPALRQLSGVELVAVASRDRAKAKRFCAEFGGVPVTGYAGLLEMPEVDAVYVALPAALHHPWALRALEAGKHVMVEKPLATRLAQTREMVEQALDRGLWLTENFSFLHHPLHARVRSLLDGGAVGEPLVFTSAFGIPPRWGDDIRYRADLGGGALLDVGTYPLRAAQAFLDAELDLLGSVLRIDRERQIDLGGSALLCSADGVSVELTFSFQSSYRSTYAMWGTEGRLTVERGFSLPGDMTARIRVERQGRAEEIAVPPCDQFAAAIRAFAGAVRDHEDFKAHSRDLLRQAELVEAISGRAHRVTVSPLAAADPRNSGG